MRQLYQRSFVTVIVSFLLSVTGLQAQVGIGTPFRTQAPNANAVLHLQSDASTPQGFLMPRLNRTSFVTLSSSDNGMIIYDQADNQFYYWVDNAWVPLSSSGNKDAWLSGAGNPSNSLGKEGDFYFDSTTKDLYRKSSSGVYTKLFSFDSDRFWQSNTPLINTYTSRNVGIGVINPTEKLEVNGSIVSSALKSVGNQVLVGDANGKIIPFSNAKGILTNDGNGVLTWEPLVSSTYNAGAGINISTNLIENTGDVDPDDDITKISEAKGDVTGTFDNLKIESGSVTNDKISDGAVDTGKLADGSVTDTKIADQSITTTKIAPSKYGNMQLVTDNTGVVTWVPATTATLGDGQIAIGSATGVNSVVPGQDISLATDGKATVRGLYERPLDTVNTPLIDQVLTWDGAKWTYTAAQNITSAAGDVSGLLNATTVEKIQNKPLDGSLAFLSASDASKVLTWNGSSWSAEPPSTFTLPNTGDGQILIGDGSAVNSLTVTGDVSLANDGTTKLTNFMGKPLSTTVVSPNQILRYNGVAWESSDISNVLIAGDLDLSNNKLQSLQGMPVSMAGISPNDVLTWDGSLWQPKPASTFTLPNTGDGELLIGNGSAVNTVAMSGDVSLANNGAASVNRLRGVNVTNAIPLANQVLQYNGTEWTHATLPDSLSGDATGSFSGVTVGKIQNTPLDASITSLGSGDASKVLTWNGTRWQAQLVPSFTLPNTGNGQILIGNGSSVNSVIMSGDVYVANNGTAKTVGLLGRIIDSTSTPAVNQVMTWDGGKWIYTTPASSLGGDASGSFSAITVNKIQGTNIDPNLASGLATDKVLTWDGTNGQWIAKAVAIPGAVNAGAGEFSIGQGGSTAAHTITGDISINTNGQALVQKLATNPLNNTVLSSADVNKILLWDGSQWIASPAPVATLSGDVTGATGATTVGKIQGTTVDASIGSLTVGDANKVLAWNGTQWVASPVGSLITIPSNATQLQGTNVSTASPSANQVLTYNSLTNEWVPANAFSMPAGDVNTSTNTVQKIQGYDVSTTPPSANQVLSYNSGTSKWEPATLPANLWTETGSTIYLNTTKPVGIGLTNPNPAHALQVNGEIRSPGVFTDNLRLGNSSGPIPGTMWYNTSGNGLFTGRDNTQFIDFVTVPSGGAAGDLIYHNGTSWSRLGLGTTGQVLTATGTGVQWQNGVTGTNATQLQGNNINNTSPVNGNLLLYDSGEWKPKSLIDILPLSTGKIFIGNASNQMVEQTVSQDAALATDGKMTVQGIQGKGIDASIASLGALDNGKILTWDGVTSKWTAKTPIAVTIPALETQSYTAAQTRYYSIDPTEFVATGGGGNITYTGIRGNAISPASGSATYAIATLHLPDGAMLTEITFLCYDDQSGKDITFYYTKNSLTGGTTDVGSISSTGSAGDQTRVYTTSDTIDNQNFSYKVTAVFNDNSQKVYGVRVKYTVTKPD